MTHIFPKDFSEPVLVLIAQGEEKLRQREWIDYAELGINDEHTPELIRIVEDIEDFMLFDEDEEEVDDDLPETYAPVHAWRALGQLKAKQAVPTLLELIIENEYLEIDWIMEDIPEVMAMIGPVCIPPLRKYLLNPKKLEWASVTTANCLAHIGNAHPENRSECITVLENALKNYKKNTKEDNAFLISFLVDLKAVESDSIIKSAFDADAVELSFMGDYEDYQVEVGILKKRITPAKRYFPKWHPLHKSEDKTPSITEKELKNFFDLVDQDIKKGKF